MDSWCRGASSLLLLPAAMALLSACDQSQPRSPELTTAYGPPVTLHEGSARTYAVLDGDVPKEVGVAVDEAFMAALPEDGAHGGVVTPEGHSVFEYVLELPEGHGTPFQHVTLDWNPAGHEPPGIYDRPHFDVHFYTISHEERMAIHPESPSFRDRATKLPPAEYIPAGYVDPGMGAVPFMGVHLVDPASPELHPESPEPFTRTFIYGSWDGRLIFLEPMVTTEFLQERRDETLSIAVAERYDPAGFYPASYSLRWDEAAGEHRIALTDLAWRE